MESPNTDYDVHDITALVTPVIATSPLVAGSVWPGFTNGQSFFFTDTQIHDISRLLCAGQIRPRIGGGWEEVIPGKGRRFLAERHINGIVHYRLRDYWQFLAQRHLVSHR